MLHSEITDFQPVPKDFDKCDDCTEFRCVKENALTYCPILTDEANGNVDASTNSSSMRTTHA